MNDRPSRAVLPPHWGPVKRLCWAIIQQAVEDVGASGVKRIGGQPDCSTYTADRMLANGMDAVEYIEGELFEYDCQIIGFKADNWRRQTKGHRQAVRDTLNACGFLPLPGGKR